MLLCRCALISGVAAYALQAAAGPETASLEPSDPEAASEATSDLWESALDPRRAPFQRLIVEGRRQLNRQTDEAARVAVSLFTDALAQFPNEADVYALRGKAYLLLREWAACSADLTRAWGKGSATEGLVELGICQSRAGQLPHAERTLLQAVARTERAEPWMRLGEVRIALGKLEAAVAALESALNQPDVERSRVEWLLTLAYDLAGDSSNRDTHAAQALKFGPSFEALTTPQIPWIDPELLDYAVALAFEARGMAEQALVRFRRLNDATTAFLWQHRAQQHLTKLSSLELPLALERDPASSATIEPASPKRSSATETSAGPLVARSKERLRPQSMDAMMAHVRRAMPKLRRCAGKQPTTVFQIQITRTAARTPGGVRPHYNAPPSGVRATPIAEPNALPIDSSQLNACSDQNGACSCLEQIAARIPLPLPAETDTWYRISFLVVAP